MEFEFDKEIDAILRKAREGNFVFADHPKSQTPSSNSIHLDADEISAFAENALPEKSKQIYIKHFAECDRCRKILSNLIPFVGENTPEPAAPQLTETFSTETAVPWYRKFFIFPNVAYTLGAIVLVFAGFTAFVVLRSFSGGASSEVSRATTPETAKFPGAGGSAAPANTASTASNAASNSLTLNNIANSSAANALVVAPNANQSDAPPATPRATAVTQSTGRKAEATKPNLPVESRISSADAATGSEMTTTDKELEADAPKPALRSAPPVAAAPPPPPPPADSAVTMRQMNELPINGRKTEDFAVQPNAKRRTSATRNKSVGGKSFAFRSGVWYDSAYQNQPTKNISRNSDEYRKLAADLRSTAETVGGTVVIVWQGTAYRIR